MPLCKTAGCPPAQYGAQASIAADESGNLMVAYNAGNKSRAPQKVFVRTSTDSGVTWSGRARISPNVGANAIYPQIAARQDGRFAVAWADSRNGGGRYQTWERDTFDGGQTWSADAQISNLGQGAPYKQPAGYGFNYGDYFDIAINNADEAFSAWGEANSYNGPGNTWWNVQTTG
jgi:hypothetical protein